MPSWPIVAVQVDSEADAVEASARAYVRAAENRDHIALWRLMSRDAQALVVATATAEGVGVREGPDVLEGLLKRDIGAPFGLGDLEIQVVARDGHVAEVTFTYSSQPESVSLPFVLEDGEWKLGIKGLDRPKP